MTKDNRIPFRNQSQGTRKGERKNETTELSKASQSNEPRVVQHYTNRTSIEGRRSVVCEVDVTLLSSIFFILAFPDYFSSTFSFLSFSYKAVFHLLTVSHAARSAHQQLNAD